MPMLSHVVPARAAERDPALEQQIDIQDTDLTTTTDTYTDGSGSGFFTWNGARYSDLQHVYFEAGIGKLSAISTTDRVRSTDLANSLVTGTTYKTRIKYGCTYNTGTNTFSETGFAELWTAAGASDVSASVVSTTINSGSGTCPATPSTVAVRFSRLIILQADPSGITDTDTSINIGQNEDITPTTTSDQLLNSPKVWTYTDHTAHPTAGWDSIRDTLFSATLASPQAVPVSACLYDLSSNTDITCVTTSSTTPDLVTSGDIQSQLHDGDQYVTNVRTGTAGTTVSIYNAFVTVQQSSASGLVSFELYDDFNPYPVSTTANDTYIPQYFLNLWDPTDFNLDTTQIVPSTTEVLSFHFEATESASKNVTASETLLQSQPCATCTPNSVISSNVDTASTSYVQLETPDYSFSMSDFASLDIGLEVKGGSGIATANGSWLIINVTVLPAYSAHETKNVAYGPQPYEVLDECTPTNAPPNRPGILVIHGGIWAGGDKSEAQYQALCNAYATQGYVVENINYRLTPSQDGGFDWPAQLGDAQLAVRYMRSTAAQTHVDPNHICAYGWSAGSQLGLLTDELQSIHASDVASQLPNYPTNTTCVADLFGPTDMAGIYSQDPTLDQQYIVPFMDGQTPSSDPRVYADASPVSYVTPSMGPVLIVQGTEDTQVSPLQSFEIQTSMQAVGVSNSFMYYSGGHAFGNVSPGQADMIREQVDAWLVGQEHP